MDKVAYLKGEEIAREEAIKPKKNNSKFNVDELSEFYNRIQREKQIRYNNSSDIEYFCQYEQS